MSQVYGMESPGKHSQTALRRPARYLVMIDGAGSTLARLFLETRELAGEFDASSEEVAVMTKGLAPAVGASGPEWDRALEGHNAAERCAAEVYTLDL